MRLILRCVKPSIYFGIISDVCIKMHPYGIIVKICKRSIGKYNILSFYHNVKKIVKADNVDLIWYHGRAD